MPMNPPIFPVFKSIELSDQEDFTLLTKEYPTYSDYNFTSLYSYHKDNLAAYSLLNGNLVVRFSDYITGEPFYSFIGTNKSAETAAILLESLQQHGIRLPLQLIPELSITEELRQSPFLEYIEDPDNFDYILDVQNLVNRSKRHYNKTKQFAIFQKTYPDHSVREIDLKDMAFHSQVLNVFKEWQISKNRREDEVFRERDALIRCLQAADELPLFSIGIFLGDQLTGFSIADLGKGEYAEFHFAKASTAYKGIFASLYIYLATFLEKKGIKYLNIEQDLGIPGLRQAKQQWHPVAYLKKYRINRR